MFLRFLPVLAAALLAAALPAAASAKPHGPDHPRHGTFDRFDAVDSVSTPADDDVSPVAEETETSEPVADKPRHDKAAKLRAKADKHRGRGKGRGKGKMTVFKGRVVSVDAAAGTVVVRVRHRNRWARVFRGEELTFSLETARIQVADTDGDGEQGVADIAADDRVLVKARVARGAADDGTPIAALRLIDLTSPETDEDEDEDEPEDEDEILDPAPVVPEPDPAV